MFRTIKLKLPYDISLLEKGERFREACQKIHANGHGRGQQQAPSVRDGQLT